MSRRDIAHLACRIRALWAWTQACYYGSTLVLIAIVLVAGAANGGRFHWNDLWGATADGLMSVRFIVAGFILWLRSSWLANRMVAAESGEDKVQLDYQSIFSIALAAIGVWTLIPNVRILVSDFIRVAFGKSLFIDYWRSSTWQASWWSSGIAVGLSLWLIFGSRGIVRLILSFRRSDTYVPAQPEE